MNLEVRQKTDQIFIALVVAVTITFILFYTEAHHTIRWLLQFGTCFVFMIYVVVLTTIQLAIGSSLKSVNRIDSASLLYILAALLASVGLIFVLA